MKIKIITVFIAAGFILSACSESSLNESQMQKTEKSLEETIAAYETENSIGNSESEVVKSDGFGNQRSVG